MYGEEVVKAAGGPVLVCTKPFFRGLRIFEIFEDFFEVGSPREKEKIFFHFRKSCWMQVVVSNQNANKKK